MNNFYFVNNGSISAMHFIDFKNQGTGEPD